MIYRIKDYLYEILEVEQNEFVKASPDDFLYGQTDNMRRIIKIDRNCDLDRKIKSLVHELSHAFKDAYGFVNLPYSAELIPNFDEVCLIDRFIVAEDYFYKNYNVNIRDYFYSKGRK